jgi:hypothetical protein
MGYSTRARYKYLVAASAQHLQTLWLELQSSGHLQQEDKLRSKRTCAWEAQRLLDVSNITNSAT